MSKTALGFGFVVFLRGQENRGTATGPSASQSRPATAGTSALRDVEKLFSEQRYDEALTALESLPPAEELKFRVLELRGVALHELHQFEKAKEVFIILIKEKPADAAPRIALARTEEMLGNLEEALRALESALAIDAKNPFALFTAGKVASRLHDDASARKFLQKAIELYPWAESAPSAHYVLSQIALRAGDAASAEIQQKLYEQKFLWADKKSAFEEKLKINPSDSAARRALAALYMEAGNGKGAANLLEPLAKNSPKDTNLMIQLAEALAMAGDPRGAFEVDRLVLQIDPSSIAARRHRAQLYILTKNFEKALAELRRAVERDPAGTVEPKLLDVIKELADAARARSLTKIEEGAGELLKQLSGK